MTKLKKKYLKLVVDNTEQGRLRSLLSKQTRLIKDKVKLQDQIKAMKTLTEVYGDEIIRIENELLNITRRSINVGNLKSSRNIRTGRNKNKNTDGDIV
jgi:hypothetical protein|tara:strand:+ start:125 stop:418 length:294 start_codon:yes stop_codon:yes gene_type:complete